MKTKPTLREWLKRERLSTEDFAEQCNISRQTISYILNDKVSATFENAMKIWATTGYEVRLVTIYPKLAKMLPSIRKIKKEDIA